MTRSLVTGADGFVGQHLVAELIGAGDRVLGAVRRRPPRLTTLPADAAEAVDWIEFDLRDAGSVRALVRDHPVDRIFHLAALTSVARSLESPVPPFEVNVLGTLHLLDALARLAETEEDPPRVLVSGSAEVYGAAATRCRPIREDCPLEPLNPYAVSKAAQEMLARQAQRADGLPIVVTRSFNHTGPGQRPPFVAAELAEGVLDVLAGAADELRVGNPDVRRDFTDVRDVVRAYVLLSERGDPGQVYNVCSGRSVGIGEIAETLAELAGRSIPVRVDPEKARPADVPEVVGSYDRLAHATGWTPELDLRRSLSDLLDALRATRD